jgi:hypothetical protein
MPPYLHPPDTPRRTGVPHRAYAADRNAGCGAGRRCGRTGVPHRAHASVRNAGCREAGGGFDVGGEDAAAGARAGDGGEVDTAVEGELADGRRGLGPGGRTTGGGAGGRGRRGVLGGKGRGRRRRRLRGGLPVLQDHDHLTDLHDVSGGEGQGDDLAADRGWEFDEGLVGLDLDEGLVPGDRVAGGDQPGDDLALLQSFADVGEDELELRHRR